MANPFARYGLFFSLLYITVNLVFYITKPALLFDMYTRWIWMLLLLVFMWTAVRKKKNTDNGMITFRDGVKQAWLTFVIGLGATYIFQYLLTHVIDTGLLDLQKEVEALQKTGRYMGLSEDKIQDQVKEIKERGPTDFSRLLFGYANLLILGAIPSFILAAIMKKETQNTTS